MRTIGVSCFECRSPGLPHPPSCLPSSYISPHRSYSRYEVYGTAYPSLPRNGKDRRYALEEPLPLAAADPGADLRRMHGVPGTDLSRWPGPGRMFPGKSTGSRTGGEPKQKKRDPMLGLGAKGQRAHSTAKPKDQSKM